MKKVVNFIKDYWITALICVGFVLLYKYISDHKLFSALMFPPLKGIWESFVEDRDVTVLNLVSSIKLLIPSVAITLAIALGLGVLVGMNSKLRKILHPIIYAFSCVPSILLSPFVVLLSPTFWWASVILIVYGTVWATLFATITGIQAIDKRYLDNAATLELKGMKRFIEKFFCNACICRNVWSITWTGILCKEIFNTWTLSESLGRIYLYGAGAGCRNDIL